MNTSMQRQVKSLAEQKQVLARLIVANARMQPKHFNISAPNEQRSSWISNDAGALPSDVSKERL